MEKYGYYPLIIPVTPSYLERWLIEWIHLQGKQLCHFQYCIPSQKGQLLKQRIFSLKSKSFILRVDPSIGLCCSGYQAEAQKLSSFAKVAAKKKNSVLPINQHLQEPFGSRDYRNHKSYRLKFLGFVPCGVNKWLAVWQIVPTLNRRSSLIWVYTVCLSFFHQYLI